MGHSTEFLVLMVGPFYLLLACWQFVGLATLADKHLCPTLERFCKSLELPTGLAGATLLAFGSSAPELAIASVSALTGRAAYAIATILASALIAFGLIPAVAVYLAGPLRLHVTVSPCRRRSRVGVAGVRCDHGLRGATGDLGAREPVGKLRPQFRRVRRVP